MWTHLGDSTRKNQNTKNGRIVNDTANIRSLQDLKRYNIVLTKIKALKVLVLGTGAQKNLSFIESHTTWIHFNVMSRNKLLFFNITNDTYSVYYIWYNWAHFRYIITLTTVFMLLKHFILIIVYYLKKLY